MGDWAYHWLYIDFFIPLWPNVAASVIWALPAFVWHHKRMNKKLEAHAEKLIAEIKGSQQ